MNSPRPYRLFPLRFGLILILAGVALLGLQPKLSLANGEDPIVVSIGDSIASGEGAPDVQKSQGGPVWNSGVSPFLSNPVTCHRSNNSGPAQMFRDVIKPQFPNSRFVHAACSGAGIDNGVLQAQFEDDGRPKVGTPQLQQVQQWLNANANGRRPTVVFLNIGANDLRFGNIVEHCLSPLEMACNHNDAVTQGLAINLDRLGGRLDTLAVAIENTLKPVKVFVIQYADPVWKTDAQVCGNAPDNDLVMRQISTAEAQWASEAVVAPLNSKLLDAVQRHAARGWNLVTPGSFRGHGYCASDRWINTYNDSQFRQGDQWGLLHPNVTGYQQYRNAINSVFSTQFSQLSPVTLSKTHPAYNLTNLEWVDHSNTETRYELQISASTGSVSTLTLDADAGSWLHSGADGVTYTYQARACNGGGCTNWSLPLSRTITPPPPPIAVPSAPSNLWDYMTVVGEIEKHTLKWTITSTNQTQIILYYQNVNSSTWTSKVMPTATTNQFTLTNAFQIGNGYRVYVKACNANGCSAPSNTIEVYL